MTEAWVYSDNADHYLPDGAITNSLCCFYVQHFRQYIPEKEIAKIHKYYDMIKSEPEKLYNNKWEKSKYKKIVSYIRVIPTKEEEEQKRKERQEEHAIYHAKFDKELAEKFAKAEAKDPRSQFFKDALKRAGTYNPFNAPTKGEIK